jgi:hypothetical protein
MDRKSKTQLSKEDKDARKCIVRNVDNDLFSLMQGPRSQYYYGVLLSYYGKSICYFSAGGIESNHTTILTVSLHETATMAPKVHLN